MAEYGVDVHDGYQSGLSFSTIARQGYSFAVVKLTQGVDYQRDMGDDWVRAARSQGLIPGGYHWLNNANGAAQARWFWRKVQECGGPDGMLIQCDNEDNATVQVTRDWAAEWAQLSGGHPFLMYSGLWWWPPHLGSFRGVDLTPYLWNSHYLIADTDTVPDDPAAFAARVPASWWVPGYGGWKRSTFTQFTSKGDAGGLANNVDLNIYEGTMAQLLALTHGGGAPTTGDDDMPLDGIDKASNENAEHYLQAIIGMTDQASNISTVAEQNKKVPNLFVARLNQMTATLAAIASKVDIDPAELDAIRAASASGSAAAFTAGVPLLVDALLAKLPPGTMTRDQLAAAVEDGVRDAFAGGLAPDATP